MRSIVWCLIGLMLAFLVTPAHASADGYGIHLESTVSLGTECGSDSHLTLPPGDHTVTVCLSARNGTDQTMYLHDIVAERLGPLVEESLYTLPADASVFYTYPIRLARSAALVSRWIAWGEGGRSGCAVAWSLIRVAMPAGATDVDGDDDTSGNPLYYTVPFDTALSCPPPTGI